MVLLCEDELTDDYGIRDLAMFDVKANIIEAFDILRVVEPKHYKL